MAVATGEKPTSGASPFRVIAAATIGNALEWFDLLTYGYFAVIIARLFFPASDETVSLLLAFGTFGVPAESIVDAVDIPMTIGNADMAATPTFASIGVLRRSSLVERPAISWRNSVSGEHAAERLYSDNGR